MPDSGAPAPVRTAEESFRLVSYPWYFDDWRGSEARASMNSRERYLYRELLDHCWEKGSLPSDERGLAGLAAVSVQEFRSGWTKVAPHFSLLSDGRYHHKKVDEKRNELIGMRVRRKKASQKAAEASAEVRASRSASRSDSVQPKDERQPNPSPSPSPSPSTSTSSSSSPKDRDSSDVVSSPKSPPEKAAFNLSRNDDDDDPRNRLIRTITTATGSPPDAKLVRSITEFLELKAVTIEAYLVDIGPRLKRLKDAPTAAFFYRQAEHFGGEASRAATLVVPKPAVKSLRSPAQMAAEVAALAAEIERRKLANGASARGGDA